MSHCFRKFRVRFLPYLLIGIISLTLAACSRVNGINPSDLPPKITPTLTIVNTPLPPTLTPVPLAARVNGEEITLAQFQAELERFKAAVGTELASEDEERVLNELVNQYLLAQAAQETGFIVDDAKVQERIDTLIVKLGSQQALSDWMNSYGYTEDQFKMDLSRSISVAWIRDQIISKVPTTAEQIHARQVLLYNQQRAQEVLAELRSGKDFITLAAQYDPITKGDLGWFPRGYLLDKKLEEAAFNLKPGEFSEVIQTAAGYHILQVIEHDPLRLLAPDALQTLQFLALQAWLDTRRSQSKIEILISQ